MDVTNLVLNLKSKIGVESIDQQMLSKAIKLLELGTIETVSSVSDLPSATTTGRDKLYLVEYDGLYKTNGTSWAPFVNNFSAIFGWGAGDVGKLGDNSTADRSSPVSAVGGFTDWCQVSAGSSSLGIRTNGTAWAWGRNYCGSMGDGTTVSKSSPVLIAGGFTDWCQVSAGGIHSLGVRQNGTAWGWGNNGANLTCCGWIGDGTATSRSSPVSVIGGFTDWRRVSAGTRFSLGLRDNGTLWAWGLNTSGQLGCGVFGSYRGSPIQVCGGFTDWCQVSAGVDHSVAVRYNGTAWAWGSSCCGKLGDGTTVAKCSPVSVVGSFTDWCQVSAGRYHSLGVRQNGTAWAWGFGTCGRLGDGTTVTKSSPVSVVGGFTNWCQVDADGCHSVGLRTNGTAWAWGSGSFGTLGDGTTVAKSSPVSVVGGFTDWCQVSNGGYVNLAIRRTHV